jgi:hypothetical protein
MTYNGRVSGRLYRKLLPSVLWFELTDGAQELVIRGKNLQCGGFQNVGRTSGRQSTVDCAETSERPAISCRG